jgi:modulator of FtsH protease HflC
MRVTRASSLLAAAGGLVAAILLWSTPFIVDATDYAVRTRFGRPIQVIQRPGLYFRLPLVDEVARLDARLLYFDPPTGEFLTEDKKNVVVSTFVVWHIDDPLRFIQNLYTRENAEARIADLVASELGTVLGRLPFNHLVSVAKDEAHIEDASATIAKDVRDQAERDYGLRIVDVGIRRLAFPDQNLEAVFNRMRAERQRIARRFRSEGEEQAIKIRAEADQQRTKLLAEAYRKSAVLKGRGEAEAARIYSRAISRDPSLYRFLRTLQSYDKVLDEKTTLILPEDSPLLGLLTQGPPSAAATRAQKP